VLILLETSQGRGQQTHAFTHALETGHHMFMKLSDGRVYCLPEGYEVDDRSLDAIRYVLNPTFTPEKVRQHLLAYWSPLTTAHETGTCCRNEYPEK
jgi:hypothetical protein